MSKWMVMACLLSLICGGTTFGQGIRKGGKPGLLTRRGQTSDETDEKRQDVEGTIWEFKVLEPKEKDPLKQVVMSGKIRIKQSSVFSVGAPKLMNAMDDAGPNQNLEAADRGSNIRGKLKGLMPRRDGPTTKGLGSDRIGDISKAARNKYKYEFDQDDDYPLSGLVDVSPDASKKNGVWSGNYEEFAGGKKVKRWRFEMRKIEE